MSVIAKPPVGDFSVTPVVQDYASAREYFTWEELRAELGMEEGGPVNLGALALRSRHERKALRWYGGRGEVETYTHSEFAANASKFANAVQGLGVSPGERVFFLSRNIPELLWGVIGCLMTGLAVGVLDPRGNADYVTNVLARTETRLVVVESTAKPVIDQVRGSLPGLKDVIVIPRHSSADATEKGDHDLKQLVDGAASEFDPHPTRASDPALIHYTEIGITGVVHNHSLAAPLYNSMRSALDLKRGDTMASLFMPAEASYLPYSVVGPFLAGACVVVVEDPAHLRNYPKILKEGPIEVWYSPQKAIDLLIRHEPGISEVLSKTRHIAVPWPCDPGFTQMSQASWGSPLHATWWDRELGSIQCSEFRACEVRPGSVGRPLPGVELKIVDGKLAVKHDVNSAFAGYWADDKRTKSRIQDGWFLTTHDARLDEDGYLWMKEGR